MPGIIPESEGVIYGRNIARKKENRLMMERSVERNGGGLCCLRVQGDEKQMGKAC